MSTLDVIRENGPWVAMGELVKLTGRDAPDLREELKELLAQGKVQKIGKKRGTRYGLPSAEAPEQNDNMDFKKEILKVMEEKQSRVSRKELCEAIGTYDAKIRPHLFELVEQGVIRDNNKKKGQLFWLARHEEEGVVEEIVEEQEKPSTKSTETSVDESKPEFTDLEALIRHGLSEIPLNVEMTGPELKHAINVSGRHKFSQASIYNMITRLSKAGKLPRLKYENKYDNGWRLYFWIESIQPISSQEEVEETKEDNEENI